MPCQVCGRPWRPGSKCANYTKCNSCSANARYQENRMRAFELLGGPKCRRCGYDRCLQALELHHLDPKKKCFDPAPNMCRKWESIVDEIQKCIVVCANCHREVGGSTKPKSKYAVEF